MVKGMKALYFDVDPQGIVDLARQRYWFDDDKKHGVELLRCFIGIESYQITRILEGNATVSENRIYLEKSDDQFKQYLDYFLKCRKRFDESNFIWIGGSKIQKKLVDDYTAHIKQRIRESRRNSHYSIMFEPKDIEEILGLETKRQELHDAIIHDAGFERMDQDDDTLYFINALDNYIETLIKPVFSEPIEEMSLDEIDRKRAQSDELVKYMEGK